MKTLQSGEQINHCSIVSTAGFVYTVSKPPCLPTAMADRIYMFSGTRLIESGTHAELMAQKGAYAEMFDMQSETYKKGIGVSL